MTQQVSSQGPVPLINIQENPLLQLVHVINHKDSRGSRINKGIETRTLIMNSARGLTLCKGQRLTRENWPLGEKKKVKINDNIQNRATLKFE